MKHVAGLPNSAGTRITVIALLRRAGSYQWRRPQRGGGGKKPAISQRYLQHLLATSATSFSRASRVATATYFKLLTKLCDG